MAISPVVLHRYLDEDLRAAGLPFNEASHWPGMSIRDAFAVSIKTSLTKKLVNAVAKDADDKARDKFLACNRACGDWKLPDQYDLKTEILLGELKRAMYEFWCKDGELLWTHPYELLDNARLGPGVNREATGTGFYSKLFSSKLSCSNTSLYFWYKRYIDQFPEWSNAERQRSSTFGDPVVSSGKLSFVPKNDEISRCICVEPTLNTFFQLGMAHIIERRLKSRFGIDLSNQQFVNRDLARLGSITNNLSTIDLSSASDSISIGVVRYLLPAFVFQELMKYRTPTIDVAGVGTLPLNMISTMGNGYTFPLQTVIFAGVVIACMRFRGLNPFKRDTSTNLWGVNGDDIVCHRSVTDDVIHLLTLLGFKVNDEKSFTEGPFRESCGSDFFLGTDVRGVFLKDTAARASLFSAINLLVRFSVRSGIPLWNLIGFLRKKVPPIFVPRTDGLSDGIHVPSYLPRVKRLRKDKTARDLQAKAYKYWAPIPVVYKFGDGRVTTPKGYKQLIYNPSGLLISLLQGSVRDSTSSVRVDAQRWKLKRRYTSSWDALPKSVRDHFDYGTDWRRWEIAAYLLFIDE